jgi:phosphoribosylaminoimidazolecarboxamide formyltransferase/IMP cyclohydrolase
MLRALLSVTDKSGLVDFARGLVALGYQLVSTGGTARTLRDASLPVTEVAEITEFPEVLDGRVKTLHPRIHGGLLADTTNPRHREALAQLEIVPISVVAVNLYPFEATVTQPHSLEDAIESIDIGGPAMIRAAAKNHGCVTVIVDPNDYAEVLSSLSKPDEPLELRRKLAAKAFRHTAFYDSLVARYLTRAGGEPELAETFTLGWRRASAFRYGENPHQAGALYRDPLAAPGLAQGERLHGLEMGYNNWNDADGAWELVADLEEPACAITKHGNPCGAAEAASLAEAFRRARDADPISAFGGVVAVNVPLDGDAARAMTEKGNKLDVVVAPDFTEEARQIFRNRKGWGQDVRLVQAPLPGNDATWTVRTLRGGVLVQSSDEDPGGEWKVAGKVTPTEEQWAAMRFLWRVIPHIKSNAIAVGVAGRLLGVGAGQMNRVQSVRLALQQAGSATRGAALASDAFFPFPDSIETAAEAGIAAIVQPGGSVKDAEVIEVADAHGIAMVFTGIRHFRH